MPASLQVQVAHVADRQGASIAATFSEVACGWAPAIIVVLVRGSV
jgi:hypothetical protein